jgi:hypothetical protein
MSSLEVFVLPPLLLQPMLKIATGCGAIGMKILLSMVSILRLELA